jgi:hypothetical protein
VTLTPANFESGVDGKGEAQTLTMWFVARDGRGGVAWTTRTVSVAASR